MDDQQIIETLKSSFLFNFRTGNVMIDTFVTGLIIMLSTYVFNMFNNVFKNCDWSSMFNWYKQRSSSQGKSCKVQTAQDWSTQQISLLFSTRSRSLTVSSQTFMN